MRWEVRWEVRRGGVRGGARFFCVSSAPAQEVDQRERRKYNE